MKKMKMVLLFGTFLMVTACSPVKMPVSNQYKLENYSAKKLADRQTRHSLLISLPDAIPGYQTEQMLYTDKPFELSAFAHSAWISSPANMLYPLIIQSLQHSHYFFAVASGPDADKTDYRLDTQLIELQQSFLTKPSKMQLVANVVLTHIADSRVVASRVISINIPCPADTPYGGVIAANQVAYAFTQQLSNFVIRHVKRDS